MDEERQQRGMAEMILQAVRRQNSDDEAAPPAEPTDVLHLTLECKNIKYIEGLWGFTSLTELELHNNLIDKILGLEHLINLKKLNLSFNRIRKMEGLQSLQRLKSLNLSDNKISVIENLDAVEDLTHFFFANNLLDQLDNVLHLRRFKNIFTINLFGNPVVDDEDYKYFMAAYFPNLRFLDHTIPDETTKKEASEKYRHVLDKMRREEVEMQEAGEARRRQEAQMKLHKDAFVEFLNGAALFDSMFEDDPETETETLYRVPGVLPLQMGFKSQMVALCTGLFETGLGECKRRESEVNSLRGGLSEAATHYQREQSRRVEAFDREHRRRISELRQSSDPDTVAIEISHCKAEISHLHESLMALEFKLVQQVKINMEEFDNNISEMVKDFINTAEETFVQCRDLEDDYYCAVKEAVLTTLTKVTKDTQNKNMPREVVMFFSDKDAVMDLLITCHDNHIFKLHDRENQLVARINAWKVALIKEIEDKELHLHRAHLSDFLKLRDELTEQLEKSQ